MIQPRTPGPTFLGAPADQSPIELGCRMRGGSMPHVLLVDDDEAFVTGLAAAVAAESFTTTVVGTLAGARAPGPPQARAGQRFAHA